MVPRADIPTWSQVEPASEPANPCPASSAAHPSPAIVGRSWRDQDQARAPGVRPARRRRAIEVGGSGDVAAGRRGLGALAAVRDGVAGVPAASWGSWQAVTPMRRPGREASVGEVSQGPCEVGLPWERRQGDGARSDFRDDPVRETPHLGRIVHRDAGNVTLSGPREGPFRAGIEGPITRCRLLVPHRGLKVDSASVTVGRHGRKRGVPDVSVTGSDPRHGSDALPCPSGEGSVAPS